MAAAAAAALLAGAVAAWVTVPSEVSTAPEPSRRPAAAPTAELMPSAGEPRGRVTPLPSEQAPGRATAHDARPGAVRSASLAAPTRFEVDRLGISMPVRPVGVAADGQMGLPSSPAIMGWYEHGPRPGDTAGATVLAAHRDMPAYGTGPAAQLERLRRGEVLTVRSGSTVWRFRVTQVTRLEKQTLDLEGIFSRTGLPRLHVITCSGRFDPGTRAYEENLVVVGTPIE